MNIETICARLTKQLSSQGYTVNMVTSREVNQDLLERSQLEGREVTAFEFIVNNNKRFITFAIDMDDEPYFTRCKSGSVNHLATLIKSRDFSFVLTGDIYNRNDLIGKFMEMMINQDARLDMEDHFNKAAEDAFKRWGIPFHVCLGFRITRYHKQFHSFDAAFEILVRPESGVRYTTYTGTLTGGKIWAFYDEAGKEVSSAAPFTL